MKDNTVRNFLQSMAPVLKKKQAAATLVKGVDGLWYILTADAQLAFENAEEAAGVFSLYIRQKV